MAMGDFLKTLNTDGFRLFGKFMRNDGKLDQAERDTLSQQKYQIENNTNQAKVLDANEAFVLESNFTMAAIDKDKGLKVEHTEVVDGVRQLSLEEKAEKKPEEKKKGFLDDPLGWVVDHPLKTLGFVAGAAALVGGGWALATGKFASMALPPLAKTLAPFAMMGAGAIAMSSCSKYDDDLDGHSDGHGNTIINQIVTIEINVGDTKALEAALDKITLILTAMSLDLSDVSNAMEILNQQLAETKALLVQIIEQQAKTADDIIALCGENNDLLRIIIEQLVEGNTLLAQIKQSVDNGNEQSVENTRAILQAIMEVKNAVNTVEKAILVLPEKIAEKLTPKLQEILVAIQKNGATLEDIKGLLADLKRLIQEEIIPNQELNNEDNADIIELLQAILDVDVTNSEALVEILKKLKEIGSDLKAIKNGIYKLIGQNEQIKQYLEKIEKNQQKGAEILQAISQTMLKIKGQLDDLTEAQKSYFEKLLKAISENTDAVNANGTKLDDMLALLNLININIVEGNEQQREAADKILAKLDELDFNIAAGMGNVVAAVLQSGDQINANLDKVLDLLAKIKAAVDEGNANALTMGNELMALLGNIGLQVVDGMDKIYEALLKGNNDLKGLLIKINNNIELQNQISETAAQKAQEQAQIIIEMLEKFGIDMTASLSAIYDQAVRGNVNLEEIKAQLQSLNDKMDKLTEAQKDYFNQMIANTMKNGQKLDGIAALIDIVNQNMVNADNEKIARLDAILKAISELGTAVIDGTDKIVKAVANNTLAVEKATAMIEAVGKAVEKVGDKVEANGKTADANAKAIMEKLDNINYTMSDGFTALLNEVAKGNLSLAEIRALLEKIDGSVNKLSENQKTYFAQMLKQAVDNGTKLDNIAQLIRVVDTDMMNANAEQKARLDKIIEKLTEANINIVGGTDKIVNAVMNNTISVDNAVKLIKELGEAVAKVGDQVEQNGKTADENAKAILAKLESIGFAMSEGFSALFDAVEKGRMTLGDIAKMVETIAGKMDKLSEQQKDYFTAMLKQAAANGAKLDGIADLIVKSNELATSNGAKLDEILAALKQANINIISGTDKIVNAVVNNTISVDNAVKLIKELGEAVAKVGDKVEQNGKTADENAKAILAKLESIGFAMSEGFSALFDAVEKGRMTLGDIAKMVETIAGKMDKLSEQQKNYFTAMLKQAAANGAKLDGIADLIVKSNELAVSNGAKLDEILAAIKQANVNIVGGTAQIVEAMAKNTISVQEGVALLKDLAKLVTDVGDKVDKNGKTADENAKAIMESLSTMNFKLHNGFEALLKAADKASGERQEILAAIKNLAADIKNSVNTLSAQQQTYFDNMLAQAIKNGDNLEAIKAKLDSIADLIKVVNNSVNNADSNRKAEAQAILDKIEAMKFTFIDGADKIVQAIISNKVNLQPVLDLLNQLDQTANKSVKIESDILAKLGDFGDMMKDITPQLTAILNAVNNNGEIGKGLATLLNKVLEKMDTMNSTNKQGFADVIAAIKALSDAINNIPGGKDYEQYLKDILAKLEAGNVSVGALSVQIEGLADLINTVNNNVIKNNQTNEKILKVVEELGPQMAGGFNVVVNAFKDGNNAQLAKLDAILAKLDNMDKNRQKEASDILQAIVDHNVQVTVDVTGKVTCTCNCNCNNTGGTGHEGIIGDLDDLLND